MGKRATAFVAILLLLSISRSASAARSKQLRYDLVVYGGTPAGISTSLAAARHNLRVALLEPSQHLGGMITGGLSSSDHGNVSVIGGIALEFFARVGQRYGQTVEWNFEPHVASEVFQQMLSENHVDVFLSSGLREQNGIHKRRSKIISLATVDGRTFQGRIFADCTYEGELMGVAGVSYTWGREETNIYHESLAGFREMQRPEHMFRVAVSPYDSERRLLPGVQAVTQERVGDGDKKVQAYGFRLCITDQAGDTIPFPKPPHYDPARYELLARLIEAQIKFTGHTPAMRDLMLISKLQGSKLDINNRGAVSTDDVGANWGYPVADARLRAQIWQEHYEYDAGFFYFLGHSERIPLSLREEINRYGLAKDEFVDTHGWPWQLYVREGRRMLGEYVMTQHDLQENVTKPDSIGMGSYESDSHNVERTAQADGTVQNEGEMYVPVHPYQIPYRTILPKRREAGNLLVPVCLSASHVAYSTLRMEPQYMIIGQAAGDAAALAIQSHKNVHDIPISELQKELTAEHAVLRLPIQ